MNRLIISGILLLVAAPSCSFSRVEAGEGVGGFLRSVGDAISPRTDVNPRYWHHKDPIYGSKCYGSPYYSSRRYDYAAFRYCPTGHCERIVTPEPGGEYVSPRFTRRDSPLELERIYPGYDSGRPGDVKYATPDPD